ncbi:MAG: hypothetical protein ACP5GI_07790 [Sulfolobales archaeon]
MREYIQINFEKLSDREISQRRTENIYANKDLIKQYLLARNALGRIGLLTGYPRLSPKFIERIDHLNRYVSDNWDKLYEKIYKDQLSILRDQEYIEGGLSRESEER